MSVLPTILSEGEYSDSPIVHAAVRATSELALVRGPAYTLLPRIVVVGQERAGKRSVVDMLAGTDVPHARQMNRHWQTEIYCFHTPEEEWRLSVSLRHHQDGMGRRLPFPKEVAFGDDCTDRETADQLLQKARFALRENHTNQRNSTICIKIFSRDCNNLALVYLPSLTPPKYSRYPDGLDAWVERLNKEAMEDPASIILLTVDPNQDLSTDVAYTLAQQFDPAGKRTSVALNRLNVMHPSLHSQVLRLLRSTASSDSGDSLVPPLSYYGIAGRTTCQVRAGVPLSVAIEAEAAFFRAWPEDVTARCGAHNLYKSLINLWHHRLTQAAESVLTALQVQLDETYKALGAEPQRDAIDVESEQMAASPLQPALGSRQDLLTQAARLERAKMYFKKILS